MFEEYPSGDSLHEPPNEETPPTPTITPTLEAEAVVEIQGVLVPVPGRSHTEDLCFLDYMRRSLALLELSGNAKEHHEILGRLEEIKGAAAGAQVISATLFEADVITQRTDAGVRENNPSYGVGSQIALARRESPDQGRSFLACSRRLVAHLQFTLAALLEGQISWAQAQIIVKNTEHLCAEHCEAVDQDLLRDPHALDGVCSRALEDEVRRLSFLYDSSDALSRMEQANAHRYCSVYPARDGMMQLSGMFSVQDGLAIRQTLMKDAASLKVGGDPRSLNQIMADLAVDRLTGRDPAKGTQVMVNLVMTDRTLYQGSGEPAYLQGYGTVPATWGRAVIKGSEAPDHAWYRAQVSLRRLYTHPQTGELLAMDSSSRSFPKNLKEFIRIRDQYCRTPYCNAPIKHFDHVVQHARGGVTSAVNGSGRCEACNQAKEQEGWEEKVIETGGRHTIEITTPTGAVYTSTAPALPGTPAA